MNCMAVEHADARVVIDVGVTFPGRTHGIDLQHPRFDHLVVAPEKLEAILLTHGHEDHIGGLPYLLRELDDARRPASDVPIYGPPYALELVKRRLDEFDLPRLDLRPTQVTQRFAVGPFEVEPYRVNHSIPDATGLVLRTAAGTVIHSGDFKIEERPLDQRAFARERLREIGEEGVDLLMSDSTNVDTEGRTTEEADVATALAPIIAAQPHRVVVALFASNVYRMQSVFAAATAAHRHVLLLGRSVLNHFRVAVKLGMLPPEAERRVVAPDDARRIPRDRLCVIATGTQGERVAALGRLSRGDHHLLDLEAGDTVIMSSRVIPGCELAVFEMMDALEQRGVTVLSRKQHPGVHASGHARRDEQRALIDMLRPRAFLPVHGTYHHLQRHAELARDAGVPETLVALNGTVVELDGGTLRAVGATTAGRVHVDRQEAVDDRQLRDRQLMGELGVAIVAFAVDSRMRLVGDVEVTTRGFLRTEVEESLLDDACDYVRADLRRLRDAEDLDEVEDAARRALKRFFGRRLRRKPIVIPLAVEAP